MEIKPAYHGESLLLRWGDTHNGRTVTLQLDEHFGASHPFKGLKCGPNGQRMQIICVLIDENEQPVSADNAGRQGAVESTVVKSENTSSIEKARTHFRDQSRTLQAVLLCKDPAFQLWIGVHPQVAEEDREERAKTILCGKLGIKSRKELSNDSPEADVWDAIETSFRYRDQVRA